MPPKRFKGEEPLPQQQQRPNFYLTQQQLQMLHCLQQTQNLTPQQQNVLQQLTHQFKLMQQHQQQLRMQQRVGGGNVRPGQQFPQSQGSFQQHAVNRAPQSGTTAQTGFVNDGNFSPATGQAQQTAGMPFKSAGGFQPQPISSTSNNQEISEFKYISSSSQVTSISLVVECLSH